MILLLLIRCWLFPLQDFVIVQYFVTLCPFLFCDHLDEEDRDLAALLSLSSWWLVIVVWLFLSLPWVCLQFVIVILTYIFWVSFMRTAMAFAWSSLSLRHSSKFSCGDSNGNWMPFCASSEESGESAHLHRLTLAFVTVQNLLCCLKWRFMCYSRQQRILWWVCTFAQAKSLDNVMNIKISCAGSKGSWESARLHRLAWAFSTVSKYHVLVEMAIFVTFMWTTNDEVSLHQQPQDFCATISALYQCFKNAPSAL